MREIEKSNPDILFGIFGDANWGNKERLSDETLKNLIEHFSSLVLSTSTVSDDLMGNGYEFLIKKFADDSGHTAAEFYTNRTVVTLICYVVYVDIICVHHFLEQLRSRLDYRLLRVAFGGGRASQSTDFHAISFNKILAFFQICNEISCRLEPLVFGRLVYRI